MRIAMRRAAGVALLALIVCGSARAAEDSLATARELYAAAAYEDALAVLNQLKGHQPKPEDARTIEQYRAFCLLALGRVDDAERAIEAVVAAAPSYQPSESDVSPRLRSAFREVRRRVLPRLVQEQYAAAKAAFDRKDYGEAADRFEQVLAALNDPDVAPAAAQPPLSDLRTLAAGFRDLSVTAATPPPAPELPPPPAPAAVVPEAPSPNRVYSAQDTNVIPPVTVRQWLPPYPSGVPIAPAQGVVEVVIDESGEVVAAAIKAAVHPAFDWQIINTARQWRYRPATLNGIPVKFRKSVQITVKP